MVYVRGFGMLEVFGTHAGCTMDATWNQISLDVLLIAHELLHTMYVI